MLYDEIQKDDPQGTELNEDERPGLNAVGGAPKRSRPLVVDPPICDEQEWHRF
jgi:hypothetical protein